MENDCICTPCKVLAGPPDYHLECCDNSGIGWFNPKCPDETHAKWADTPEPRRNELIVSMVLGTLDRHGTAMFGPDVAPGSLEQHPRMAPVHITYYEWIELGRPVEVVVTVTSKETE